MPDNAFYYHAAYVATAVIYGGYALSIWLRSRRLAAHSAAAATPVANAAEDGRTR